METFKSFLFFIDKYFNLYYNKKQIYGGSYGKFTSYTIKGVGITS